MLMPIIRIFHKLHRGWIVNVYVLLEGKLIISSLIKINTGKEDKYSTDIYYQL